MHWHNTVQSVRRYTRCDYSNYTHYKWECTCMTWNTINDCSPIRDQPPRTWFIMCDLPSKWTYTGSSHTTTPRAIVWTMDIEKVEDIFDDRLVRSYGNKTHGLFWEHNYCVLWYRCCRKDDIKFIVNKQSR